MSIANARRIVSKLRQERQGAVSALPAMPLLTELDGFAGGIVAIDMPLLTELDEIAGGDVAIDMPLLTELDHPRPPAVRACATCHAAPDGA